MSELIEQERNPFTEAITADVVKEILLKQVDKAKAGNTAAASLILKIARAKGGKDSSVRRNPDTPVSKPKASKGQVLAALSHGSATAAELADRCSSSEESIREILEGDARFVVSIRGAWSIDTSRVRSEARARRGR